MSNIWSVQGQRIEIDCLTVGVWVMALRWIVQPFGVCRVMPLRWIVQPFGVCRVMALRWIVQPFGVCRVMALRSIVQLLECGSIKTLRSIVQPLECVKALRSSVQPVGRLSNLWNVGQGIETDCPTFGVWVKAFRWIVQPLEPT